MNRALSTKQFILSLSLIVICGLGFALFLHNYLYGSNLSPKDLKNYIPVSRKPISFRAEINTPEDELLVFDSTLIVSGKTSEKSVVLISNNEDDYSLESSDKGDFSKIINLNPGLNEITINLFDALGNNKSEKRTVYYSKEKI